MFLMYTSTFRHNSLPYMVGFVEPILHPSTYYEDPKTAFVLHLVFDSSRLRYLLATALILSAIPAAVVTGVTRDYGRPVAPLTLILRSNSDAVDRSFSFFFHFSSQGIPVLVHLDFPELCAFIRSFRSFVMPV